jgi:aspartate/tyrosine/aromatic aminotransferase
MAIAAVVLASFGGLEPACAQGSAPPFAGKSISILVGSAPGGMRERIKTMRHQLVEGLKAAGVQRDMGFITSQIGMFSYSGLSKDQMVRLRNEFGVYGTDTGRMCVAALNSKNLAYVCQSIAKVV